MEGVDDTKTRTGKDGDDRADPTPWPVAAKVRSDLRTLILRCISIGVGLGILWELDSIRRWLMDLILVLKGR